MFSLDTQQLNRFKLVQALAVAFGEDDSDIAEMLTQAGFVPSERACQLAAQAVFLTFEAHSLGKLSAPATPPLTNGHTARRTLKRLPAPSGAAASCPHCGNAFNPRGLKKHIGACKDNPANQ